MRVHDGHSVLACSDSAVSLFAVLLDVAMVVVAGVTVVFMVVVDGVFCAVIVMAKHVHAVVGSTAQVGAWSAEHMHIITSELMP